MIPLILALTNIEGRVGKVYFYSYVLYFEIIEPNLIPEFILQVIAILNDVKDGQSWPQALKHVPKRKIHNAKLGDEEDEDREHLRFNPRSGRDVREDYRKNLIYDLLLNDK